MGRINQSFCLNCYWKAGDDLDAFLGAAADIGFAAVEIWGRDGAPWDELLKLAPKHGLKLASMIGHKSLGDGLNNPANHDRIEAELRESIDLAADLGMPGMICFSGNRNGLTDYVGARNTAAGLQRVAGYAEEKGVNLNLELLNSKVNHKDYQCDATEWGVTVCELVNSPRVKLLYDIYHMQIMEGDLIRNIQTYHRHFGHYHTAGNPGRNDLDDQQEIYYPAVMRAIADTGYELYVGHEFVPKGEDKLAALRQAFQVCDI